MKCEIRTCTRREPRTGKTYSGLCVGHALLLSLSKETRAAFVSRQEAQDMLKGRTLRDERRAA